MSYAHEKSVTIELPIEIHLSYREFAKDHRKSLEETLAGLLSVPAALARVYHL